MPTQHSVTVVCRRFASVIREVESGAHIEVTRYGEAVAVLVPCSDNREQQT
jgi:prevent-host-death family protein